MSGSPHPPELEQEQKRGRAWAVYGRAAHATMALADAGQPVGDAAREALAVLYLDALVAEGGEGGQEAVAAVKALEELRHPTLHLFRIKGSGDIYMAKDAAQAGRMWSEDVGDPDLFDEVELVEEEPLTLVASGFDKTAPEISPDGAPVEKTIQQWEAFAKDRKPGLFWEWDR